MFRLALIFILLAGGQAQARVFNPKDSIFAAYLRGSGGQSNLGHSAYAFSSGDDTRFELKDKPAYHYSGEVGLMFMISDQSRIRIGFEGLQAREVEAVGKVGGAKAMDVTSRVLSMMPTANLELDFSQGEGTKYFTFAGVGYAKVTSTNIYDLNATGLGAYGLSDDYKETVSGNAIMGQVGVGAEWPAIDNVNFSFELGYRYLVASKLNYENSQNTAEGTTVEDGAAKIRNGTEARTLDMSGMFVGFSFRFFIPPLNQ